MIYVSSSCVKHKKIKDSVEELARNGFQNIELSGGTEYYGDFEDDLLELKEKYNLKYICHNYFPPPKEHLVLNLASLNDEIYKKTFEHLRQAIELSKSLGAKKFGFHAGFFIDIKVSEIGKKISKNNLFDKERSTQRFCDGFKELQNIAGDLKLYIENNVFSSTNAKTYENENLFMLTNSMEYKELKEMIDFNLLLDIAHLKVSTKTLGLNFEEELSNMINQSDYIHISDNDALHDLNNKLQENSSLVELLKRQDLKNKDYTLEIYDGMDAIKETYKILQEVIQ
ncbi:sugar phosphate isomerase/epimerase [Aliarcobacter cryaerophilus]|uniref:sugar phosphate isomerase/epimerase family protein n=1 Tax=Aliarcobacter cryaerophilus TaxID=28198 RepID=UPI0021B5B465|nr:sugar phosphate isomerase/epimerase [Aliarcobacter cryaerophilus]MCT7487123.1 sugar phosphate isomerase/epimerase [Aliarcobacter cryaerophilus]MCT7491563.1 sugar phosphate isomerase/epimerase [Aliarcobacter cryaerophilus]